MSADPVDVVARTLLYEGYLLYPYRPSALKNRQRFNFGVLYPRAFCDAQRGAEAWRMQTEVPVLGSDETTVEVRVRFLHLRAAPAQPPDADSTWHEAVEREVKVRQPLRALAHDGVTVPFCFQETARLEGSATLAARDCQPGCRLLGVTVANQAAIDDEMCASRDAALLRSLVSTHVAFAVEDGELVSLLDPPAPLREAAAACTNVGAWPVLVGDEGRCDRMLASPIVLYDYPRIAAESAGDLFDGTEIDEILALRILALTDREKEEARGSDERARQILDRTENLPAEHWRKLHGAIRAARNEGGGAS